MERFVDGVCCNSKFSFIASVTVYVEDAGWYDVLLCNSIKFMWNMLIGITCNCAIQSLYVEYAGWYDVLLCHSIIMLNMLVGMTCYCVNLSLYGEDAYWYDILLLWTSDHCLS